MGQFPSVRSQMPRIAIEDEDDAEEEWGVNLASGCCLVKLSALLRDDVLPRVIAFVTANI